MVLFFAINSVRNSGNHVKGVDVSAYQGDIDWKKLADQDIYFAFIKATEGKDHVDKNFEKNWKEARKAHLKVGAYHFVNFDQDGKTQADHFINTVPKENDSLPPVIDLELYGDYLNKPMDKNKVQAIVNDMIDQALFAQKCLFKFFHITATPLNSALQYIDSFLILAGKSPCRHLTSDGDGGLRCRHCHRPYACYGKKSQHKSTKAQRPTSMPVAAFFASSELTVLAFIDGDGLQLCSQPM